MAPTTSKKVTPVTGQRSIGTMTVLPVKADGVRIALAVAIGLITLAPDVSAQPDDGAYCRDMAATGYLQSCATLYSYGRGTCIQFDRGNDWFSILRQLDSTTGDKKLAPAILVTAVSDLCPWHQSRLP